LLEYKAMIKGEDHKDGDEDIQAI